MRKSILLALCLSFFTTFCSAVIFPDKPNTTGGEYIVDIANMITPADQAKINTIASKLWSDKQIPLIVVTINSLTQQQASNDTVTTYTQALFNHWGIGSPARNYGVLLLISKNDRRARIELGQAWNHRYDSDSQKIMDNMIIPQFKANHFSAGIVAGAEGLNQMVRGLQIPNAPMTLQDWLIIAGVIVAIIVLIGVIISLFKSGKKGWGWALLLALGGLLLFLFLRGRNGGGGFGGGSGGGGGASGSW